MTTVLYSAGKAGQPHSYNMWHLFKTPSFDPVPPFPVNRLALDLCTLLSSLRCAVKLVRCWLCCQACANNLVLLCWLRWSCCQACAVLG